MHLSMTALFLSIAIAIIQGDVRDDCFCGVANYEGRRITRGNLSKPFQYPWMIILINVNEQPYCGGSLISDRHVSNKKLSWQTLSFTFLQVLTAQHCISFQ